MQHIPVLHDESLSLLDPQKGETVIDLTLGLGGHAKSFLECIGKKGQFFGIDADEKNLRHAEEILRGKNVELVHANFREFISGAKLETHAAGCDVLFADLGLSSPHIDDPERGFSFREDGPMDLRFDQSHGEPASLLLQKETEEELAAIFKEYGEVERAKPLARAICEKRDSVTFTRTLDLVNVAEDIYKWKAKKVLPQIFQALRIAANDEVGALEDLLEHGPSLLHPGGRMGIISYHSLEDRLVKNRFRELTTAPKDAVIGADIAPPSYELLTKKAIQANLEEVKQNSRSRSAKFRVIRKIA